MIVWLRWDKVWVSMGIGLGNYHQEMCPGTGNRLTVPVRFIPGAKVWVSINFKGPGFGGSGWYSQHLRKH